MKEHYSQGVVLRASFPSHIPSYTGGPPDSKLLEEVESGYGIGIAVPGPDQFPTNRITFCSSYHLPTRFAGNLLYHDRESGDVGRDPVRYKRFWTPFVSFVRNASRMQEFLNFWTELLCPCGNTEE